ncbi:probable ADP-ribosylation factor GTPase-activating protein AGD14 [Abrus precatorius]|uniref:Probable ADP-ribosylation factor GTPase-activating protein AGD14 n=1 Tax=Abrus precatorius TaxID=3816 RepID=A0A8B8JN58_ABRPR|nr:probable ADP-ribosylation factor GTPase-activating protein AGD14 [Abrus precatorius]
MAKFTAEEVNALQAGGNERAKQIYFKEWNSLRHSYPDSCNIHKLREFIKHVYVERRFTGERSNDNISNIRLNNKEESYGSRKSNSLCFEFKGPHSNPGARSDDTSFRYLYDESRSPRYTQKYIRQGSYTRSPIKFEVVDDRFRDDDYKSRRHSNLELKLRQISIDGQKNVDKAQLPVTRSLGDILRENALSLHEVTPSGGEGSIEENPSERVINQESSTSLSSKSQVSDVVAGVGSNTLCLPQSDESNWAIFEPSTEGNDPKIPSTNNLKPSTTEATFETTTSAKNPLDLLLFELSGPLTPGTGGMSQVPSGDNNDPTTRIVENACTWDFPPTSIEQKTTTPNNTSFWSLTSNTTTELAQPSNEFPPHAEVHEAKDSIKVSHAQKPSSMQYIPSISTGYSSTIQPTNALVKNVASNNQPSIAPNTNDTSSVFAEPSSQITSKPTQETRLDVGSKFSNVETRSSGRMELPEDLFTSSYSAGPASHVGWQNVQPHGMKYGMHYYPNAMPPSTLPITPKSTNPFEVIEGRSLTHASSLPTTTSSHSRMPAASPKTGLMHVSSLGSLETMASQPPNYASPIPMGIYIDQVNKEKPTRPQRADSFNSESSAFGLRDTIQHLGGVYEIPKTTNSFSNTRGNPFD